MRTLLAIIVGFVIAGCVEKQKPPTSAESAFDARKQFMELRGEAIQLLAIKHQIQLPKAETIVSEYYRKHDMMLSILLYAEEPPTKDKMGRDFSQLSNGVAATISSLASEHGMKEEAVAAFITDLRLFESNQK